MKKLIFLALFLSTTCLYAMEGQWLKRTRDEEQETEPSKRQHVCDLKEFTPELLVPKLLQNRGIIKMILEDPRPVEQIKLLWLMSEMDLPILDEKLSVGQLQEIVQNPNVCKLILGNKDLLKRILEFGLLQAAKKDDRDMVQLLLSQGVDVNTSEWFENESGPTPLHYAAEKGHYELCKILLDAGADLGVWDGDYCMTPLSCAVCSGKKEVVELLLDKGSSFYDDNDDLPFTPLNWAAELGYLDIAKVLVDRGAKVNYLPGPVATALKKSKFDVVNFLIGRGAKLKKYDLDKALLEAAEKGLDLRFNYLVDHYGADPNQMLDVNLRMTFLGRLNRVKLEKMMGRRGIDS